MSLPGLEVEDLDLEGIASRLAWHKFDHEEFERLHRDSGYGNSLPLGTVLRDADGNMWLVGNASGTAYSEGCGCCSDPIEAVEIAFLAELIEVNAEPVESDVCSMSVAEIGIAPHVYMPFWRAGLRTADDILQWIHDGCPKIRNAGRKRTEIMMDAVQGLASVEAVECTG